MRVLPVTLVSVLSLATASAWAQQTYVSPLAPPQPYVSPLVAPAPPMPPAMEYPPPPPPDEMPPPPLQSMAPSAIQPPEAMASPPQLAPAQVPATRQVQTQGNITFVSGGVSDEGRATIDQFKGQSNLHLLFAVKGSGEYLADVGVTLTDPRGNPVLDTVSNGPIFLAQVPPGRYRLTVTSQGQAQTRNINMSAAPQSLSFYWASAS